jgi:hypothetical protein
LWKKQKKEKKKKKKKEKKFLRQVFLSGKSVY